MFYQTEAKVQGWLASAVFADGGECLLCLGRSVPHVRAGYAAALAGLLTAEERGRVRSIALRCWQGAADRGRWIARGELPIPPPAAYPAQRLAAA